MCVDSLLFGVGGARRPVEKLASFCNLVVALGYPVAKFAARGATIVPEYHKSA